MCKDVFIKHLEERKENVGFHSQMYCRGAEGNIGHVEPIQEFVPQIPMA